jgi:hypothetical protein
MWQHWINFILGLLVLILAYTGVGTTTLAIMGVLIIIFSLWGGLAGSGSDQRKMAQT